MKVYGFFRIPPAADTGVPVYGYRCMSGLSIPEKRAGNIRHVKQDGGYPLGWENGFYGEIRFSRISFWHGQPDSCIATGKTFLSAFPARRPPGKCMQVLPAVSVNSNRPFLVYFGGGCITHPDRNRSFIADWNGFVHFFHWQAICCCFSILASSAMI